MFDRKIVLLRNPLFVTQYKYANKAVVHINRYVVS